MTQIGTSKTEKRITRHGRVRAKVTGTAERPRLAVFRSNQHLYAQVIDDTAGKTIASADTREAKGENKGAALGKVIAEKCKAQGISKVVFDRGGFTYMGSIAAAAEAAREGGLEF